ncbi:outer membrane protein Iml2/Tetratricopeptide repeat protein 39 [Boletus coccyginus]|nr:outer membrane protein Iml2/Tetratricopeptide repeat protein 39 [Boletus coccyginus]
MHPAESLRVASEGFDLLFANDLVGALDLFGDDCYRDSPFHLMGLGVCAFLKAALGMEPELMEDATQFLESSQAGAKKYMKLAKSCEPCHRFTPGLEWEILHTDTVLLLGLTHALSESYRGYLQCLYEFNSAHSKFTKLFKTIYPSGLDDYATPGHTPTPSRKGSIHNIRSSPTHPAPQARSSGFLTRWGFVSSTSAPPTAPMLGTMNNPSSGEIEELILSGAAFGYGLFNLVFSLLPARVRTLVGILGYNHDRQLALQALAVSAARSDVHSVFAGLTLMTYYGVILLMTGYQADEEHIVRQYKGIVNKVSARYPNGTLWILNKAKIQRMTRDFEGAIKTLREGLAPDRPETFPQADVLLAFELALTLLGFRRYEESAEIFLELMKMNSWSPATYHFIAAGCYVSSGRLDEAQSLLDKIPQSISNRRRRLPTELFIKKKLEFYKQKQARRGGDPVRYVEAIRISPAEELGIFWNTHAHINETTALAHIEELSKFTPPIGIEKKHSSAQSAPLDGTHLDLDTPDELAIRSLILGVVHRTMGDYATGRMLLHDALKHGANVEISTWVSPVAYFELAVLEMKEGERKAAARDATSEKVAGKDEEWGHTFKVAKEMLAEAAGLCTREMDLSSRLDNRIVMLREEIEKKMGMVGYEG